MQAASPNTSSSLKLGAYLLPTLRQNVKHPNKIGKIVYFNHRTNSSAQEEDKQPPRNCYEKKVRIFEFSIFSNFVVFCFWIFFKSLALVEIFYEQEACTIGLETLPVSLRTTYGTYRTGGGSSKHCKLVVAVASELAITYYCSTGR